MRNCFHICGIIMSIGVVAAGCGGSDDNSGSSGSGSTTACKSLCDKQVAGGCSLLSATECKQFCDAVYQSVDAACQQKLTASSQCQAGAADACNATECQTQMQAANACLGSADGG